VLFDNHSVKGYHCVIREKRAAFIYIWACEYISTNMLASDL